MPTGLIATVLVAAVLGGALGARLAKATSWKGAVVAIVAIAASESVSSLFRPHFILTILVTLIAAGIAGALLKLKVGQTALAILGMILVAGSLSFIAGYLLPNL